MTFAEHITTNVLLPRLNDRRILVVYDEHKRFEEICASIASAQCRVIFTVKRPVSSRQEAMERWKEMAGDTTYQSQMLIYCQDPAPKDNGERQQHPFSSYAAVGASFPNTSRASDEYKMLCYGFLKDRVTEIDQLFANGEEPGFDLIDNLAGGSHSHPRLQALFGTADASKIIPDFLVPPSSGIQKELNDTTDWLPELKQLMERTLGLQLNPQITKAAVVREKLWLYLLFSEFANDLPSKVPQALASIPKANGPHLHFATSLCSGLRHHTEKKEAYREAAQTVEDDLDLVRECEGIVDLGKIDTFAFEEKNFLAQAAMAIRTNQWDIARTILDTHKKSLWTEEGERKLLWRILELGLDTLEHIKRAEVQLQHVGHTGRELCEVFDSDLVKADRAYRNLEEAAAQTYEGYEEIEHIVQVTRDAYRSHFNQLQTKFLSAVQREGWPLNEMAANNETYVSQIDPPLRDGKRAVYFLIDALRLDLAQDLESRLHEHQVKRLLACAQLPCITKYGMASLLPEAATRLKFSQEGSDVLPLYDGQKVDTRQSRLGVFEAKLNDRVCTSNLSNFLEDTKTPAGLNSFNNRIKSADLMILTSTELDELGEGTTTDNIQLIPTVMRKLKLALSRCVQLGFDTAVIATDHGFLWVEDTGSGSVCTKPAGDWPIAKRRCLIGQGDDTPGTLKFSTKELGIPTELPSMVIPKALATFSKGSGYFHEGISLQESLVPRLVVNFTKAAVQAIEGKNPSIELSRKKTKFSSRIVSVNISWPGSPDMFSDGYEFKLAAFQNKEEIGYPSSGMQVDGTSGLVKIKQGESIKVSLRLADAAVEGPVQIKVINPSTEKVIDSLALEFETHVF